MSGAAMDGSAAFLLCESIGVFCLRGQEWPIVRRETRTKLCSREETHGLGRQIPAIR